MLLPTHPTPTPTHPDYLLEYSHKLQPAENKIMREKHVKV